MRIAICEDNPSDREWLISLCERYAEKHSMLMEIIPFEHTDALLADSRVMGMEALILDIQMDATVSGTEAARILRERGYGGALIFATVSKDFYGEGFQVGALHYLIKPVNPVDFEEAMSRVARAVGIFERYITVTSLRKRIQIPLRHIFYVEVDKHNTILYTTAGRVPVSLSLCEVESLLPDSNFLKCYRSCIVNLDKIARVEENDFLMKNNVRVPITKRLNVQIKERYMQYIFRSNDR